MTLIGQSITRTDGWEKVTGQAIYGPDLKMPGMLFGKALRSPYPHAKITSIDLSKAARLPGVKATLTGKDFPLARYGTDMKDTTFLAVDRVRYIGEPVAVVAATSEDIAEEALALIQVEYEELPAVFEPVEAARPGAPLVHPELHTYRHGPGAIPVPGTNICNHFKLRKGEVEKGFARADLLFEETYRSQKVQHCYIEPHATLARADAAGKLTIWSSTQAPYRQRAEIAESLGLPLNMVRIIATYCGGGFGGKTSVKLEPLCALLSLKANYRPVKMVFTREEEFTASVARHPAVIQVKTGIKKDGRLTAAEVSIYWNTGAYSEKGEIVSRNAGYSCPGPYEVPNVKVDSYCVYTNTLTAGSFRGFGVPQITWALEQHMDMMARSLSLDPLEIRMINGVSEGSESATGQVLHSVGLKETLKMAAAELPFSPDPVGIQGEPWGKKKENLRLGRGIACCHKNTATGTSSSALVKVDEDGTVCLLTSACEIGQGSNTVLAQIAAEELGVSVKEVTMANPDTEVTPFDFGTVSSRITFFTGNAVREAAAEARERLFELAALKLEANPKDLEMRGGRVCVRGSPEAGLTLKEIFQPSAHYGFRRGYVLGRGSFTPLDDEPLNPDTGQSRKPTAFWMYVTQAAEVEVDTETGEVKVTKICSAHDLGKAVNPLNCESQVQGSLAFGLGYALQEELVTKGGKVLNPSFMDYSIPTALDMPAVVPILVESAPHRDGPYGAKGMAEAATAPMGAAIANAVFDAAGVPIREGPITAEKVFWALREVGSR